MKLTSTGRTIIIIGIFVIILASLGIVCVQQIHEQNQLDNEPVQGKLELNELQIEELSARKGELEKQLSQTISQVETAKPTLSQPVETVTIMSTLLNIAANQSVEVTQISSSGLSSESLEGVTCSVRSFTGKIRGDIPNIVSFVTALNSRLATGVIKTIAITIPATTSSEKASADFRLVVYTYSGD